MANAVTSGYVLTGVAEVKAALAKLGVSDTVVREATDEAGRILVTEATSIAPRKSGAMAATIKPNRAYNNLRVQAGSATVPYAYTFHAVAMGKSKGGMTFRVPPHRRAGHYVGAYIAKRRIRNLPFIFMAAERKRQAVYDAYVAALSRLIASAA